MTQPSTYPRSGTFNWGRMILWGIAAFYAYGALVHVLNMLSLTLRDGPGGSLGRG